MARIRTVKPDFFKNDELASLGPYAMLMFEGLWCLSDRDGRLEDRPARIKAEILPYFDVDANEILASLESKGFICRYTVDGKGYVWIPTFRTHQRITGKEAETPSKIPAHPSDVPPSDPQPKKKAGGETSEKQPGNAGETPETTGKEGKGKKSEPNGSGGAPLAGHGSDRAPNHAFDPVARVMGQVHQRLGWSMPKAPDIRPQLKDDSHVWVLIEEFGEDGTVELFCFAAETWDHAPTWAAVCRQRNQLWDKLTNRRVPLTVVEGGAEPFIPTEIAEAR